MPVVIGRIRIIIGVVYARGNSPTPQIGVREVHPRIQHSNDNARSIGIVPCFRRFDFRCAPLLAEQRVSRLGVQIVGLNEIIGFYFLNTIRIERKRTTVHYTKLAIRRKCPARQFLSRAVRANGQHYPIGK